MNIHEETFKTYEGWLRVGRVVIKGNIARAGVSVYGPASRISHHLFSKSQTVKIDYGEPLIIEDLKITDDNEELEDTDGYLQKDIYEILEYFDEDKNEKQ